VVSLLNGGRSSPRHSIAELSSARTL
jgi:hypothetical protein